MTAPGPPKAIGKGLVSNAFIAHLLTERYVAGRSQNSLVTGLARHGADLSPATLTGTCAAAGALLAPLEDGDHRAVAGLVAPARGRDQLAGVHPTRGQRPRQRPGQRAGEVVAVGVPRPGHRLLRHGPHPLGRGAGPPRRDRPDHRPTRRTPPPAGAACADGRRGRGSWSSPATSTASTPRPAARPPGW